jgi:hypothetical protein
MNGTKTKRRFVITIPFPERKEFFLIWVSTFTGLCAAKLFDFVLPFLGLTGEPFVQVLKEPAREAALYLLFPILVLAGIIFVATMIVAIFAGLVWKFFAWLRGEEPF